jgi:hypothetical protein
MTGKTRGLRILYLPGKNQLVYQNYKGHQSWGMYAPTQSHVVVDSHDMCTHNAHMHAVSETQRAAESMRHADM